MTNEDVRILDKEKFSATVDEMKTLTSDFHFAETPAVKHFLAQLIIMKAQQLVDIANSKTKNYEE